MMLFQESKRRRFTIFLKLVALAVLAMASQVTWAGSCSASNVEPVTFGTLSVKKTATVGTVVASTNASLTVRCSGGFTGAGYSGFFLQAANTRGFSRVRLPDGTYAWNLGIAGMGMRITGVTNASFMITGLSPGQWDSYYANQTSTLGPITFTFKYELVVTGALGTGGTLSGQIWENEWHDIGYNYSGVMSGSQVTAGTIVVNPITPACDLTTGTANQVITLAEASSKDLPTIGAIAKPTDFQLSLINCVPQTTVSLSLDGTTDLANDQLKNVSGSARGVALQVLHDNNPIAFNKAFTAGNAGDKATMDIPLTVRYYRNGDLHAGSIATQAIINLSYN